MELGKVLLWMDGWMEVRPAARGRCCSVESLLHRRTPRYQRKLELKSTLQVI